MVKIGPGEALSVNDRPVALDDLGDAVDEVTGKDHDARVMISGDRNIVRGRVMQIMNALQDAGYVKIALIAEEVVP